MQQISQRTLGLVRDALTALQPEEVDSFIELQQFWKQILFDEGLPQAFIDVAATYHFRWLDIVPHLYTGKFGNQNLNFAYLVPPAIQDEYLKKLVKFAVKKSEGTELGEQILNALRSDLQPSRNQLDKSTPPELAKLPAKEGLLKDLSLEFQNQSSVALVFIDLDNFKTVNDQLGHLAGDKCLIDVVNEISKVIRGKGKLYRCGGDEFAVLLPNFSTSEAHATAERIRSEVAAMPAVGQKVPVTASIGVASSDVSGLNTAPVLYEKADEAMYISKFTTKNRVSVWPSSKEDQELAQRNREASVATH
jgi:diguanylate cyclase (GGDEF)-like protein